jgi:hypothetical protein
MKEIIVDISDQGEITIQTIGFSGKSCVIETQFLKDLLGQETMKLLTPAYFEEERVEIKKYLNLCG